MARIRSTRQAKLIRQGILYSLWAKSPLSFERNQYIVVSQQNWPWLTEKAFFTHLGRDIAKIIERVVSKYESHS